MFQRNRVEVPPKGIDQPSQTPARKPLLYLFIYSFICSFIMSGFPFTPIISFICSLWPCQNDARGENTKINYVLDTTGEKEKRTSKKKVDGRSTSSHDNKKFGTRSKEKQRGMAFGFRKTATAV
jgi:hypothetical protein